MHIPRIAHLDRDFVDSIDTTAIAAHHPILLRSNSSR
jgi:hypothetical protein